MSRSLFRAAGVLSLCLVSQAAPAAEPPALATPDDLGAFMEGYYLRPQPELIAAFVTALNGSSLVKKAPDAAPTVAFLSEVFAANPKRLPEWQVLILKQDEETRAALMGALTLSEKGGVLALDGHSPGLNDMLWGAFFASGNAKFLQRLVEQLPYYGERKDLALFLTGATARWSLASNAQSKPRVRSILESIALRTDKRSRELLAELLLVDPASMKEETIEIVKRQKEAGVWK